MRSLSSSRPGTSRYVLRSGYVGAFGHSNKMGRRRAHALLMPFFYARLFFIDNRGNRPTPGGPPHKKTSKPTEGRCSSLGAVAFFVFLGRLLLWLACGLQVFVYCACCRSSGGWSTTPHSWVWPDLAGFGWVWLGLAGLAGFSWF